MARPLRILFPGAWYHVVNRGLERRAVFRQPGDIARFLALAREISKRFGVEVHAYCLMGNHYHLLLRTLDANLPEAMRHLDGVYTQTFNRVHERDGPLFRGRYRAVLVQADAHLLCVARYVHLNPVEAGLVDRPEDWPHSSYRAYLDPNHTPPWLRTELVLGRFGSVGARTRHRAFVEQGLDPETRDFSSTRRRSPVLGLDAYRNEIARACRPPDPVARLELPDLARPHVRPALDVVARAVAAAFEVSEDDLKNVRAHRRRVTSHARGAFVHLAVHLAGHRSKDAAIWLGYRRKSSGSVVAKRFRSTLNDCDEVRARTERAVESLRQLR